MRNAEDIKKRLDAVKEIKNYTEALTTLADIQYEIGVEACHERKLMREDIGLLKQMILGNGQPEHSVLTRLSKVEECVGKTGESLDEINLTIRGDRRSKGLIDDVRELKKSNAIVEKLSWIIIAAIILEFLARLFNLI